MKRFSPSPSFFARLLTALTGFGAGLLNGLLGAAGGILLVAVLPRLAPSSPRHPSADRRGGEPDRRDILATALAVMLPVSAVSGVFYWLGGIRPSPTLLVSLVLPAAAGGLLGAKLLAGIPNHILKRIFAAVVIVAGLRMLF